MDNNTQTSTKLAVDIPGAAELTSLSKRMIQYYLKTGALVRRKCGRRTVIPVRSLEAFLRVDHKSPARRARPESDRAS